MKIRWIEIYKKTFLNFIFLKEYERFSIFENYPKYFFVSDVILKRIKNIYIKRVLFSIFSIFFLFNIFVKFIFGLFKKVLVKKNKIDNFQKIFINSSNKLEFAIKKEIIEKDDVLVLEYPYKICKQKYQGFKTVGIENCLCYTSYFKALIYSSLASIYLFFKNGINGGVYNFISFDFFLMYVFLDKLPDNTNIFFNNQKDRWALLFDSFNNLKKHLIQHGTNKIILKHKNANKFIGFDGTYYYLNMPFKLNDIDFLYGFTEEEVKYLLLGEQKVKNNIEIKIIGYPLELTSIDDKKIEDKKTVLIIGYHKLYFENELKLLKILNDKKYFVFLKPHPVLDYNIYEKLSNQVNFKLIKERNFYPKVDIVFSYSSTLAFEYNDVGIRVVYYDDIIKDKSLGIEKNLVLNLMNS